MSMTFVPVRNRGKPSADPAAIQKMLDENNQLIQTIVDYQAKGRSNDATHIQQLLHRNLVYLATLADSNHSSMQQLLQNPSQAGGTPMGAPSAGPQGPPPGPSGNAGANVSQGSADVHTNPNLPNQANGMPPATMVGPTPTSTSDTNITSHQSGPSTPHVPNSGSFKGSMMAHQSPAQPMQQPNMPNQTPASHFPPYSQQQISQQQQQQQQQTLASSMQAGSASMMQGNAPPNQQPTMPAAYRPQTMQGQSPYNQQAQASPQGSYNPQYPANQQSYIANQQMPRHGYPGTMPAPNATQYPQQQGPGYGNPGQQVRNYNYNQGPPQPQGQPTGQPYPGYNQNPQYRGGYQQ